MYKTKNSQINSKQKASQKNNKAIEKEIQDLINQIRSGIVCTKQVLNIRH